MTHYLSKGSRLATRMFGLKDFLLIQSDLEELAQYYKEGGEEGEQAHKMTHLVPGNRSPSSSVY